MHALSIKQPYAEWIARGVKRIEYRTWRSRVVVGGDLLIVASKTPGDGYAGEPQGVAICIVHVAKIVGIGGDWQWHIANVRRVDPTPIKGYAALFRVDEALIHVVDGATARDAHAKRSELAKRYARYAPKRLEV